MTQLEFCRWLSEKQVEYMRACLAGLNSPSDLQLTSALAPFRKEERNPGPVGWTVRPGSALSVIFQGPPMLYTFTRHPLVRLVPGGPRCYSLQFGIAPLRKWFSVTWLYLDESEVYLSHRLAPELQDPTVLERLATDVGVEAQEYRCAEDEISSSVFPLPSPTLDSLLKLRIDPSHFLHYSPAAKVKGYINIRRNRVHRLTVRTALTELWYLDKDASWVPYSLEDLKYDLKSRYVQTLPPPRLGTESVAVAVPEDVGNRSSARTASSLPFTALEVVAPTPGELNRRKRGRESGNASLYMLAEVASRSAKIVKELVEFKN